MKKTLYCSPNKKLCGVCGGLADYFNVDPTLIRLLFAIISLYTAFVFGLIVYFILALIIPKPPENYYQIFNNTSRRLTKGHTKSLCGVCSGFAEYMDCDVTLVRVLFVLLVLFFGTGVLAYIISAIIMPRPFDYQQTNYNYPPNYNQYQQQNFAQNPYQQNGDANAQQPPYNQNNGQWQQPPQNNN